jgi:parallel beta-helix repeat protein
MVYIKAGTYNERVIPQRSGSANNYIVYAAYPGDTVTINGSGVSVPWTDGLFHIVRKNYIKVSGLRVINAGPSLHNIGILVRYSSHIVIENNSTYNTGSSGIGVWFSDNVIVTNNEVERAGQNENEESISIADTDVFEASYNHVHHSEKVGIDAKQGSSNGRIFGNHIHHTGKTGIYVDAWDMHTYNIEIFGNTVHDSVTNGMAVASERGGLLTNIKIYNNLVYDNQLVGFYMSDCCISSHPVQNVQIVNNTFYGSGLNWGGGIHFKNSQAQDIVIRNNILSQNLSFQIKVNDGVPMANLSVDHNLIDGYRDASGEIYGDDYVEGDPLFVNPAGGDFHLQPGSPAIDSASPTAAPATDFDGLPRPSKAGYDIGAYELQYEFVLNSDPPAQAIQPGESAVYALQVSAVGAFDAPVTLAHSPAPAGLTLSLEPTTVIPGNAATLTLNDTHTGTLTLLPGLAHTVSITATGDGLVETETVRLIVGGVRFYSPIMIKE